MITLLVFVAMIFDCFASLERVNLAKDVGLNLLMRCRCFLFDDVPCGSVPVMKRKLCASIAQYHCLLRRKSNYSTESSCCSDSPPETSSPLNGKFNCSLWYWLRKSSHQTL